MSWNQLATGQKLRGYIETCTIAAGIIHQNLGLSTGHSLLSEGKKRLCSLVSWLSLIPRLSLFYTASNGKLGGALEQGYILVTGIKLPVRHIYYISSNKHIALNCCPSNSVSLNQTLAKNCAIICSFKNGDFVSSFIAFISCKQTAFRYYYFNLFS